MMFRRRRFAFVVFLLLLGMLLGVGVVNAPKYSLKLRAGEVQTGMSRAEVEQLLGPPRFVCQVSKFVDRTTLLWGNQIFQVCVTLDPDGRVEQVQVFRPNSFYERNIGRWTRNF